MFKINSIHHSKKKIRHINIHWVLQKEKFILSTYTSHEQIKTFQIRTTCKQSYKHAKQSHVLINLGAGLTSFLYSINKLATSLMSNSSSNWSGLYLSSRSFEFAWCWLQEKTKVSVHAFYVTLTQLKKAVNLPWSSRPSGCHRGCGMRQIRECIY